MISIGLAFLAGVAADHFVPSIYTYIKSYFPTAAVAAVEGAVKSEL